MHACSRSLSPRIKTNQKAMFPIVSNNMRWYVDTYAQLAQANYIVCLNWFSQFDCSMGMPLLQLFELTYIYS